MHPFVTEGMGLVGEAEALIGTNAPLLPLLCYHWQHKMNGALWQRIIKWYLRYSTTMFCCRFTQDMAGHATPVESIHPPVKYLQLALD